jgi:hypothetical protein
VLYVNLEIDPASAINRFLKIYEALGLPMKTHGGHRDLEPARSRVPLDQLVPKAGPEGERTNTRCDHYRPDLQGHHRRREQRLGDGSVL